MSTQAFKTIRFAPNVTIFREGDRADCAYIIKKGSVKITKRGPSGRNIPIATAESGGIVGEMAIVSEAPRSASVITQEEVEVLAVSKQSFETRLKEIDPFLHSLIKTVIARLRKTSSHTVALFEKAKTAQSKKSSEPTKPVQSNLSRQSFSNVNFMLADPNSQTRNSLRGGLFGFGFREISDISSFEQIKEKIAKDYFDLLILDSTFGVTNLVELIQEIRHGKKCRNPFMSILVLSESDKGRFMETLLHAGCDRVLPKPISIKNVIEVIKEMCTHRKPFVVTRDYVGPDRIGFKEDTADDAPSFEAPSTLAAKVFGGLSQEQVEEKISEGLAQFNEIKMERHLVQLSWLLDRLDPENGNPANLHFILDQADEILEDLAVRASQSDYGSSSITCRDMRDLVSTLKRDNAPQQVQWHGMSTFYSDLLESMPLIQQQNSISANPAFMA